MKEFLINYVNMRNSMIIFVFIGGIALGGVLAWLMVCKRKRLGGIAERKTEEKEQNKQKIREFLETRSRITNDEAERMLKVSNATAERYLDELEKEGFLRQVGRTGRSVYYERNL